MSQVEFENEAPQAEARLFLRLWGYARPDAWSFLFAVAVTPIIAGAQLLQPWLLKKAIDEHIVPMVLEGLSGLALAYLGSVLLSYLLEASYTLSVAWGGQRTVVRIREALYRHCLRLPQSFFDRQPAGRLLTRLTSDVESLGDALGAGAVTITLDLLMIVGVLAAMLVLDARLTLVMLAFAPFLLAAIEVVRRRLRALYGEIRDALAAVNAYLAERIDGVEVVQLYRDEARSLRHFEERNRRYRDACSTSNVYDALLFAMVDGASAIFVALMVWFGCGLAAEQLGFSMGDAGPVSAGLLVAFIEYLDRLFRPLRDLSNKIAILQRAGAALAKIFALVDVPEAAGADQPAGGPVATGHLALRDVRFSYRPGGEDVLRGIDMDVAPGEVVAVVGSSGSGKTTLTRLLDRSYTGYRGSITLAGVELSEIQPAALRRVVATVRQDVQVFSETLRFNVDLGNPGITAADCEQAAALVHADRFVNRLGWDHVLAERGRDLSVGEAQLLTFARTMAHAPDVVILDEATASIDSLTEALVQDAIARILESKTVIVVAHRLSTIQHADRIVVMAHGEVVEVGRHDELLALGGRYADLVAAGRGMLPG